MFLPCWLLNRFLVYSKQWFIILIFYLENTDLLETPDNFGRTPLMYCVLSDRLDCAKLLIKMKANLHHVDKAGRSALHLAAHKVILICL